jgi:hypothetical protein
MDVLRQFGKEPTVDDRQRIEELLNECPELAPIIRRTLESAAQGRRQGMAGSFREMEQRSHLLGRGLARDLTEAQIQEHLATLPNHHPCPKCGRICEAKPDKRRLKTVDGTIPAAELKCFCSTCRRTFFPRSTALGAEPSRS